MSVLRRLFTLWRSKRWVRWLADGIVLIVALSAVSMWQTRNHVRGEAQQFSLPTLDGTLVDNASLLGKPTLVVFWAPWCRVCHANAGAIASVASWFGDRVQVVSIASEYGSVDDVRLVAEREELAGTVLLGGDHTSRTWGVLAFPAFFFLDAEGRVRSSTSGYTTSAGLAARLLLDP
jgi:peroxiredoxin